MKLPLKVIYETYDNDDKVFVRNIVDANNEIIIETDCGIYPPFLDDAEAIVIAVNNYYLGIPL